MKKIRLPAEWEEQDGVLMAWPHQETDWKPYLESVVPVFSSIIKEITKREKLLLVAPHIEEAKKILLENGAKEENLLLYPIENNDTWARDFGPITIYRKKKPVILDFGFNGWGLKFSADKDNLINQKLYYSGAFGKAKFKKMPMILEGGSIESDGKGTLLTTSECLLSPNRNPAFSKKKIEKKLKKYLGAEKVLWLDFGYLEGDDTDSHIDTLARLCPKDTIVYVGRPEKEDPHYYAMAQMEEELSRFVTLKNKPFRLLELPFAKPCLDENNKRMPATYANYLVINGAVLYPTYRDPEKDKKAQAVLAEAYPEREIIGIDCLPLIYQHGSLHCLTMQIPKGVLEE